MRRRWQAVSGWAALVSALLWVTKFTLLSAAPDAPFTAPFVGFLAPAFGSLLGIVAATGALLPVLRGRRWWLAVPASAVAAVATIIAASVVSAAGARLMAGASSPLVRVEGSILVGAAFWALVAAWLLRPRLTSARLGALLAIGGACWLVAGIAAAGGVTVEGWVVGLYQAGLWTYLLSTALGLVLAVRDRRPRLAALLVGGYVGASVLGAVPLLSGQLGLIALAVACLAAARRLVRPGATGAATA